MVNTTSSRREVAVEAYELATATVDATVSITSGDLLGVYSPVGVEERGALEAMELERRDLWILDARSLGLQGANGSVDQMGKKGDPL